MVRGGFKGCGRARGWGGSRAASKAAARIQMAAGGGGGWSSRQHWHCHWHWHPQSCCWYLQASCVTCVTATCLSVLGYPHHRPPPRSAGGLRAGRLRAVVDGWVRREVPSVPAPGALLQLHPRVAQRLRPAGGARARHVSGYRKGARRCGEGVERGTLAGKVVGDVTVLVGV